MKTIMHLDLIGEDPQTGRRCGQGFVRKTIDLPFAPSADMQLDDGAWKESRKIISVTLSIGDDPYLYIYLGIDRPESEDAFDRTIEMYKSHGWIPD